MTTRCSGRLRRTAAALTATVLALAGLSLAPAAAGAGAHGRGGDPITVMTRNVYLGGDITRPLTATQGLPPEQQGPAFVAANTTLREIVDQTSFPLRARRLALEVAATRPDQCATCA